MSPTWHPSAADLGRCLRGELPDTQAGRVADPQRGLGQLLPRGQPQLVQVCHRGAGRLGVNGVGQRGPAPEGECLAEPGCGLARAVGQRRAPVRHQLNEAGHVGRFCGHREPVAGRVRLDDGPGGQRLAQPGDQRL